MAYTEKGCWGEFEVQKKTRGALELELESNH